MIKSGVWVSRKCTWVFLAQVVGDSLVLDDFFGDSSKESV